MEIKMPPRSCHSKIVLRERKTRFVDIFRTTPPQTVCPNFYVLAHANGCSFQPQCSYCYLKSSFWHLQSPHVFTNVEDILREVRRWIRTDKLESYTLNTGNLSDSLGFEHLRPLTAELVELFRREAEQGGRPHTLLLVTKGGQRECASLFKVPPCANVVVSFSVNAPTAAARYERGAAKVADRFAAARRLKRLGWRIRIRIDPIIRGYDYRLVALKTRELCPERITLGTLRAEPNLDHYVSHSLLSGLIREQGDGHLARYPFEERRKMYEQVLTVLGRDCPIALCEEVPQMWKALGLDTTNFTCNCAS